MSNEPRQPPSIDIRAASVADLPSIFHLVRELLRELGEEGEQAGEIDVAGVGNALQSGGQFFAAVAELEGEIVGVVTVVETVAIYANGRYGIINEMYVMPAHRSAGVGERLLASVKETARTRGWSRVDVTAPEAARWTRTTRFYERNGFVFAGPKLRFPIESQ
ncbi:MAG TPA: GNAT family N-acetyltransferase [Thermoanaerobaculia bacterium]|nr:GNAT family N-acetyltransferase [Thermoanaerobaculia bacterium]